MNCKLCIQRSLVFLAMVLLFTFLFSVYSANAQGGMRQNLFIIRSSFAKAMLFMILRITEIIMLPSAEMKTAELLLFQEIGQTGRLFLPKKPCQASCGEMNFLLQLGKTVLF